MVKQNNELRRPEKAHLAYQNSEPNTSTHLHSAVNASINSDISSTDFSSENSSSSRSFPHDLINNKNETKTRSKSKFTVEHIYPKNYDSKDSQPKNILKQKQDRDFLLNQYRENSQIYHANQYGGELSDDDISILTPAPAQALDTSKRRYRKKPIVNVFTGSVSSTSNSNSDSYSSVQTKSTTDHDKNGRAINVDIEKGLGIPPEADTNGQYFNCEKIQQILTQRELERELHRNRSNKDFKEKFNQFKEDSIEIIKSEPAYFWTLIILFILTAIFICTFFPIAHINSLFDNHGRSTSMHEDLTDYVYPTLGAIRTSLIDPDTPSAAFTKLNKDGNTWDLVFSDEFNAEGRTFYPKMDQFWEAVDLNYAATKDLEWYDPDAAITNKGTLNIRMDSIEQHGLNYRSAMLQSWNKLCLTEGSLEISAKLPGSAHTAGLWPGLWMLGNLARPGYMSSTEGVWPYSYNECDAGITANQSSPDGISHLPGQKLSKCVCKGADHPNPGTGRGAPEIDILEGAHSTDIVSGVASQTLQIAPFDIWYLPDYEFVEVYNSTKSNIAHFLGTPYQEMLSTMTTINETWFQNVVDPAHPYVAYPEIETRFQKYSVEYRSKLKKKEDNYCRFSVGDDPVSTIYGAALHPNGNIGWRDMPKEPMSIVLNLGISPSWSMIQWLNIMFPVIFEIDYVRIYQPKGMKQMTCDPPDYPTSQYIQDHLKAYMNPNLTSWEAAGYTFPKNKLTTKC